MDASARAALLAQGGVLRRSFFSPPQKSINSLEIYCVTGQESVTSWLGRSHFIDSRALWQAGGVVKTFRLCSRNTLNAFPAWEREENFLAVRAG
jgi:hypothetical protein